MTDLWQDLRYGARTLRRTPLFTLAVLCTLALGIGGATTMYGVVHAVLLRPLPFGDDERLVRVQQTIARPDGGAQRVGMSQMNFAALRERSRLVEATTAHRFRAWALAGAAGAERVVGIQVSGGWLRTVGVRPRLGRGFTPDEERLGEDARVAVVSHALWQGRLGGAPDAVGRTLVLNGQPHVVVGVMPPGYAYPYEAELWLPLRVDPTLGAPRDLNVTARLRPGATPEGLQAELDALGAELRAADAANREMTGLVARPLRTELVGDARPLLLVLLGAVGFVLLIACANVASLMLARAAARAQEFGVRTALGATRWRQLRQLLTESALLALAGGALGVLLAVGALGAASALVPESMREVMPTVRADWRVLGAALLLSLGCGVALGLAPALRASSLRPWQALRGAARVAGGGTRLLHGIVVAETAVAVVLLTGGALLVRDLLARMARDSGVRGEGAVTARLALPEATYGDAAHRTRFVLRVAERLEGAPGVAAAGFTSTEPFASGGTLVHVEPGGRAGAREAAGARPSVHQRTVTPGFFPAMGMRLLRGRLLTARDVPGAEPVAVVNAAMARRFWPDEDPVGQRVRDGAGDDAPWRTVVGVVADVAEPLDTRETWYVPYAQAGPAMPTTFASLGPTLVVRGTGDPAALVPALRAAMRELDPTVPVHDVRALAELERAVLAPSRAGALATSGFGVVGLALAALGLYGVLAYVTAQRGREIAIRMALGADPRRVMRAVVARSLAIVGTGLAIGLAGAAALGRALGGLLQHTGAADPVAIAAVLLLLTTVALVAGLVPARRAARTDAAVVLRGDA